MCLLNSLEKKSLFKQKNNCVHFGKETSILYTE